LLSDKPDSVTEFNIRPNASYPRQSWKWFLLGLVVLGLAIALRLAWLGFWVVLPFTILELAFLVALMRMVRHRANYIERIRIEDNKVQIFHLEENHNADWSFPLYWTRVELKSPVYRWYPHRLLVGTSGRWVEIGKCLTDAERGGLADAIRDEIRRHLDRSEASHA